jgi:predicted O-linked N-acetylglucosamine transferase (SPINDLY family)
MQAAQDLATGIAHHNAGRLAQAGAIYRAILQQQPQHADALQLLGLVLHQGGDDPAAAGLIRQAIAVAPRNAVYHANLGVVLLRMRQLGEAAAAFRTALRLNPSDFGAQSNLGVALTGLGDHDGAVKAAGAALRLRPGDQTALGNRAHALEAMGQYGKALEVRDAAVQAAPGHYQGQLGRGTLLLAMGRVAEALEALEQAAALGQGDIRAAQARIVAMNYLPGMTMAQIGAAARGLTAEVEAAIPDVTAISPAGGAADRPLRIGYVSGDFRNHPVGYFLHAVLAARDPAQGVVVCYDNGVRDDAMTVALRAASDGWRSIAGLDDGRATELIRGDGIDILVDLAGHTAGNRLGVFARRAAPVQVAWLGYFGTTGLSAMDAVIADRHVLPPGDEAHFTEAVQRMPHSYLCFTPPVEAGPVAPLPAGLDGPVTFGCFNNPAKINPAVLAVWARVLGSVAGSRLLLKSAQYADKSIRRPVTQALEAQGIAAGRVMFEPASPIAGLFEAYGRVDIALDPFPFAGGATTAQALWMGVPVVSLAAELWPGRQGASLLGAAGYPGWAVADVDDYVALAAALAADRPALMAIRRGLRDRVVASPLCDAGLFARDLQDVYRRLWQKTEALSSGEKGAS